MAYGTESVPKVDKIFGPGNTWVTEAKAQVDRDPAGAARDYPGGPVRGARHRRRAAPTRRSSPRTCSRRPSTARIRRCCCVTTSAELAAGRHRGRRRAEGAAARAASIVEGALAHSSVIVVDDLETAFAISQPLRARAPDPADRASRATWLDKVTAAGLGVSRAVDAGVGRRLLQRHEPRAADLRFRARAIRASASTDFLRSMTVQELTFEGLRAIGPIAIDARRSRRARRARVGRQRAARGRGTERPHERRCSISRARSCAASGRTCPAPTSPAAFG